MSGVKGKSGMPKGRTNNPNGRPKGSKNKVSASVKARIAQYVEDDWDTYISEVESIEDAKDRVRAKTELIKLVVPRPVSEEEADANRAFETEFVKRIFGKRKEES